MPIAEKLMGKAGHALEVEVHNLFLYNGFDAKRNVETRAGEFDVLAEFGSVDVAVECKEFNPNSSATVVRDMISNVAKKAEHLGIKNAVLVTTKRPSAELADWATAVGVILVGYDRIARIRGELVKLPFESRAPHLVKAFGLANSDTDPAVKRRKLFVDRLIRGEITATTIKRGAFDLALGAKWYLLGAFLGLAIAAGIGAYFVPGFKEQLKSFLVLLVAGPLAYFIWRHQNKPKARRGRRKGRGS